MRRVICSSLATMAAALVTGGMIALGGATPASAAPVHAMPSITIMSDSASQLRVIPDSASGCAGYVCIDINGSGTTVNYISTVVQNPYHRPYTSTGRVYVNGRPVHSFGSHKLRAYPAKERYTWNSPSYSFRKGQRVCIQWTGISGFPCETIG